jgi:hypothetical protein
MTTFKGVMRSYGAAVRRADRVQQQHNREAARRYKLQEKTQQLQNAASAESDWKSYVNVLKTLHIDHSDMINWDTISDEPKPMEPIREFKQEEMAKWQLDIFQPSFFDKLLGLTEKKIKNLTDLLEQARKRDKSIHEAKLSNFASELKDWNVMQSIALGIKRKDVQAYKDALDFFKPFDEISQLGKELRLNLNEEYIDIEFDTFADGIIPTFELSLTSTGKLSRKDMSLTKFNDLYFEHICSCAIRIAKEISILFPVSHIVITVISKDLDKATGHNANSAVLSFLTTPDKIEQLNLETIQPSETIKSFIHNLKFTKSNGFSPVPKIDIKSSILS